MIPAITRWRIKNSFREAREEIYETLADEVAKDGTKRTDTISAVFKSWHERDSARGLKIAVAYGSIARSMNEGGMSFADAIAPFIPFEENMLIWAGEKNGTLEEALRKAVRTKGLFASMKDAVRAALAQPLLGFAGVLLTSCVLGTVMWPIIMRDIKEQYWPAWALPQIYWDMWLARNWPVLTIIFVLLWAYVYTLPRWTGRSRQFFDRFPPWSTYRNENANILLTTLAGFLTNGFVITDALIHIRDRATPYLRWHLARIIPRIESEGSDSLAAFNTGILSQSMLDRLVDASRTRDLDKTIVHVGDKALVSLVKFVKLRAHVVSSIGSGIVAMFFIYSSAVQLIATQQATDDYAAQLKNGNRIRTN